MNIDNNSIDFYYDIVKYYHESNNTINIFDKNNIWFFDTYFMDFEINDNNNDKLLDIFTITLNKYPQDLLNFKSKISSINEHILEFTIKLKSSKLFELILDNISDLEQYNNIYDNNLIYRALLSNNFNFILILLKKGFPLINCKISYFRYFIKYNNCNYKFVKNNNNNNNSKDIFKINYDCNYKFVKNINNNLEKLITNSKDIFKIYYDRIWNRIYERRRNNFIHKWILNPKSCYIKRLAINFI